MKKAKPKLLVLELWGVGDLAMASDFLNAAVGKYEVTLLAKAHAVALQKRFWPEVALTPFTAPWTPFSGKYRLWKWPWREMRGLFGRLRAERFDVAVSARRDPRDHWLMQRSGAGRRIGFPRAGGGVFLTDRLPLLPSRSHRYEYWRQVARALEVDLPGQGGITRPNKRETSGPVIVHSGAARDPRVWPLERFAEVVRMLRDSGVKTEFLCDERQRPGFANLGGADPITPTSIEDLIDRLDSARAFVGNDSGPGHLAALLGVPTVTVYGPVLPEMYGPLHPRAAAVEGSPCRYKPCLDSCRFKENHCIRDIGVERVWAEVESMLGMRGDGYE